MIGKILFLKLTTLLLSSDFSTTKATQTTQTTTRRTTWHPTTTPPIKVPGGCLYKGEFYRYGATVESDYYNCHGKYCDNDGLAAWDDECAFFTPQCDGWLERLPGQCCHVCHSTPTSPTTVPSSSTPSTKPSISTPVDGCVYEGKIYANGEYVKKDPNNCFGAQCNYGVVHSRTQSCYYPPNVCNGLWKNITGQCCEVCVNETTTPTTTASTSAPQKCKIGNKLFVVGQRTNSDRCNVCKCTSNGTESCSNIKCDKAVLDCEVKYRPVGACCYTCGSVQISTSLLLLLTLFLASTENQAV